MTKRYAKRRTTRKRPTRSMVGYKRRGRKMRGRGFWDSVLKFGKKANTFLKKSKLISKVSGALGEAGVPYASGISGVSGAVGYGRKKRRRRVVRRRRGAGIRLAGGRRRRGRGVGLAGGRKKKAYGRRPTSGMLHVGY